MAKLPEERFSDGKRIRELIQAITKLFDGSDLEDMSIDSKVYLSFNHEKFPIQRRMNKTKSIKIEGYWWLAEGQALKYGWQGYGDCKVQDIRGVNRIWLTRTFLTGYWYIRFNGEWVDIEAQTMTTKRTKKTKKAVKEWVTCTVSKTFYDNVLDSFLEPMEDVCTKHNEGLLNEKELER